MTALDHPTHAIAAETRTVAAVARVAGGLRNFLRSLFHRRQANRLKDLSDHDLADIGLTRTDIIVSLRAPLWVDPTVRLRDFARERQSIEDGARRVC